MKWWNIIFGVLWLLLAVGAATGAHFNKWFIALAFVLVAFGEFTRQ